MAELLSPERLSVPNFPNRLLRVCVKGAVAAKRAARVLHWLPAAGHAQLRLFECAAFRLRMRSNSLSPLGRIC